MYSYRAYGLRVKSAIHFPSLITLRGQEADCAIDFGRVGPPPSRANAIASGERFRVTDAGIYLFWNGVGTLLVRDGISITVDPEPGADENVLRSVILGAGFATLLHQRGRLVLHASAVAVGGRALVFLGTRGQGKSTLAMALHARGHALLADDVAAVVLGVSPPVVVPAYPQINVSPATLMAFSHDPIKHRRVEPEIEKRAFPVPELFSDASVPLTNIYVLDEGPENVLESIPPREALIELMRHSYCFSILTKAEKVTHLSQTAYLVSATTVSRARIRRSLEDLPDLSQLLENMVKTHGS
jgi:hypothetical protein